MIFETVENASFLTVFSKAVLRIQFEQVYNFVKLTLNQTTDFYINPCPNLKHLQTTNQMWLND